MDNDVIDDESSDSDYDEISTEFLEAIVAGNMLKIEDCLDDAHAIVNSKNEDGRTALILACEQQDPVLVNLLLQNNADVNIVDQFAMTALHEATLRSAIGIMTTLLEANANVHAGRASPLHFACCGPAIKLLLRYGARIDSQNPSGQTPLHSAIRRKCYDACVSLIQLKANLHAKDNAGFTPLHFASAAGCSDIMNLLLQHHHHQLETDINICQDSPLHVAAQNGHENLVLLLIQNNAQLETRNDNGETPLHLAARQGYADVVQTLLAFDHHNCCCIKDKFDGTALNCAIYHGHLAIVEQFLRHPNASLMINSTNNRGQTPLHIAITALVKAHICSDSLNLYIKIIKLLVENGAEFNIRDYSGKSPLECISNIAQLEDVRMLLEEQAVCIKFAGKK